MSDRPRSAAAAGRVKLGEASASLGAAVLEPAETDGPKVPVAGSAAAVPVVVLGGSGYVAGEALRLLAGHPRLAVAGVVSESQPGQLVAEAFPHLSGAYPAMRFSAVEELPRLIAMAAMTAMAAEDADAARGAETAGGAEPAAGRSPSSAAAGATAGAAAGRVAALCAAPHGAAAKLVDLLLAAAERAGARLHVVDLSADFRFAAAADYERVYGHPHGAPGRLARFGCALPEHAELAFAAAGGLAGGRGGTSAEIGADGGIGTRGAAGQRTSGPARRIEIEHVGHPGCFPTAVLLAAVPLVRLGWIEPSLQVVAVTGSTGAGRSPSATTHHPARRSNLFAYSPLAHRHEPEMRALAAAAAGQPVAIHFVPQAGPFARGIYATLQARLLRPAAPGREAETAAAVTADLAGFYAAAPFVDVGAEPPRLQDVVGSNRCRLSVAVAGDRLVAFSAIDNLTKGAAGGGIQWLNRLLGFAETAGLRQPGIGWL
jgi:N-acetyl-gamma-glutamylphosphate reductase